MIRGGKEIDAPPEKSGKLFGCAGADESAVDPEPKGGEQVWIVS
jgi:hypothetical protein